MKLKRTIATLALTLTALALAACGERPNPLGEATPATGEEIIVGSANFTESNVLGELYAQAMTAKGLTASTKPDIGSREVYLQALKDGSISVVPEYTGNLLLFLDKASTATTAAEIEAALPKAAGDQLKVLKSSDAADQDVYVVTKQFAEQNKVASIADLKTLAPQSILGGPSELKERSYGPPGLEQIYGVKFKSFKPYDAAAVKIKDLNDNKIQVATFFTTESAIIDNGFVMLEDPQGMILPQNVIPLVRSDIASNTTAVQAIESVQAALTTTDLTLLNKQVDVEHQNPDDVAAAWLKSKGLA